MVPVIAVFQNKAEVSHEICEGLCIGYLYFWLNVTTLISQPGSYQKWALKMLLWNGQAERLKSSKNMG